MKRRLTKLVVFLLLGAIVNVAVAWGCALLVDLGWLREVDGVGATVTSQRSYSILLWRGFGAIRVGADPTDWAMEHEHEPHWIKLSELPRWAALRSGQLRLDQRLIEDARGWPAITLRCGIDSLGNSSPRWAISAGLFVKDYATTGRVPGGPAPPIILPLRPIWSGIAINTIFYAALLWLLTLGPLTVRRMIRRKRGHCIKCGYDLRGHSGGEGGCSECGWRREEAS